MKRSSTERSTRMRERAQQSWPALANTASGAAAAARSRSASAKTTFADLPPSSSVTRLIVPAAPAAMPRPTSVEPVNAIFATSGMLDQALPAHAAGPGDHVQHALGQARLERDPLQLERGQRRQLGRLQHDRVAGRERGRDLPRGDHEREVPRHDQAHDAERLAEGHVDAAGDGDRVAEQALRRARVVAERLHHHLHLAARVGDRLADVAGLERGEVLRRAPRARRRGGAAARRGRPATRRATPGTPPWRGPPRRRPPLRPRAAPRPSPARWRARLPRSWRAGLAALEHAAALVVGHDLVEQPLLRLPVVEVVAPDGLAERLAREVAVSHRSTASRRVDGNGSASASA